jgi:hypothetical protein
MLERYSHIRTEAKRAAIAALEQASITTSQAVSQSADGARSVSFSIKVGTKLGTVTTQ